MDYLIIHITINFLDEVTKIWRKALAAFTGSIWAVVQVLISVRHPHSKAALLFAGYCIIAVLMAAIAVGTCRLRRVLRGTLVLYIVSFVTAGACYAIYNYSLTGYIIESNMLSKGQLIAGIFIIIAVKNLMKILIRVRRKYQNNIYHIRLKIKDQYVYLRGLCDTGNVLVDPYTGKNVHIVTATVLKNILNKGERDIRCRLVPYNSVGQSRGLLPVIDAECMEIYEDDRVIFKDTAVIGIYKGELSGSDLYDALINAAVFKCN
jgi:stage II sporulation protein GA (sporulation sigma-E factor processing peptidase)